MRAPSNKNYLVPFLLLVLAAAMYLYAVHIYSRYRWVPVTMPIDLGIGVTKISEFQVDLRTKYVIELASDRNLPMQELNCLLGTPFGKSGECNGVDSPVDLSWQLTSKGVPVASGSSREKNGASLGVKVSRFIGEFIGEPGVPYELEVQSLKDASILAITNPRIFVSVNAMEHKNHVVNSQLLRSGAVLVAFISFIRFVVLIVIHFRSRRSNET